MNSVSCRLTVWLLLPSSRRFEFNIMNGKWEVSINEAGFFWHANEVAN